jgi:acetate kinase
VRREVCSRLAFLGVELDDAANDQAEPDAEIGCARVRVVVIRAREELVAARTVRELLGCG